jgi:DHA2 family multidrug resistance protein
MLPQYLQSLMGYTAMQAGMALTAGGAATLVMMPLVGFLTRKVQPKFLISFGLAIEAIACWHLHSITTEISFGYIAWARVLQAIGLPFLFVPISMVAYAGLPPGKNNSASALMNTMRNLGGSFGISLAVALLARRGQFHQSRIVGSVDAFTPAGAHHTTRESLVQLGQSIHVQAAVASYIDIFWLLAVLAAVAVPLMLVLLRRVEHGEGAAAH